MSWSTASLWRDPDFRRFWQADATSQIGTQVGMLALPLTAALVLDANAWQIGLLAAIGQLPVIFFGLVAGAWLDRRRKRPVMVAADLSRAGLLALIPLAYWLDALSMPVLYLVAFGAGIFTILFDLGYLAYVPELVGRGRLIDANSKLEATASGAQVVGPGLAGVLVGLLSAPVTILIDSFSFLVSAFFLHQIEFEEPTPEEVENRPSIKAEIITGLRAVNHDAVLRALLAAGGIFSFFGAAFMAVYTLFMIDDLDLSSTEIGIIYAIGGIGALAGSITAKPLSARIETGYLLIGSMAGFGITGLFIPLAVLVDRYALPLVIASEFLQWMMLLIYIVNALTLRQVRTPASLLGRTNSSFVFVSRGVQPVGSLVGGALGGIIGLPMTLVVGELGMFLAVAALVFSPLRRGNVDQDERESELYALGQTIVDDAGAISVSPVAGES